jgi:hypothetical protein
VAERGGFESNSRCHFTSDGLNSPQQWLNIRRIQRAVKLERICLLEVRASRRWCPSRTTGFMAQIERTWTPDGGIYDEAEKAAAGWRWYR